MRILSVRYSYLETQDIKPATIVMSNIIQIICNVMIGRSLCLMPYINQISAMMTYAAQVITDAFFFPIIQTSYTCGSVMIGPNTTAKYTHLSIDVLTGFFFLRFTWCNLWYAFPDIRCNYNISIIERKHKHIQTKSRRIVDFMSWQGIKDDYQTQCGITSFSKEDENV